MPWPAHNHVEWGGRRGLDTPEIWQNGVRVCKPENDGETVPWGQETFDSIDVETYVNDLAVYQVRWWFERPESFISPFCYLDWVSSTWITPSGRPDPAYSFRAQLGDPVTGGGSPEVGHPYQCALVITWGSDVRTHGPGSRGRIYSPAPSIPVQAMTGRIDRAFADQAAASASVLIERLAHGNLPTGDRRHPHIVSPLAGGVRSRIDWVHVDTRLDVLRKRAEHQEPERRTHEVDHDWFDE